MNILIGIAYAVVLMSLYAFMIMKFVPVPVGFGKRVLVAAGISFVAALVSLVVQEVVNGRLNVGLSNTWPFFATFFATMIYVSKMSNADRERRGQA